MASKRSGGAVPEMGAESGQRLVGAAVAVGFGVLILFAASNFARPLGAGDVFWQVRTGEIALDTGQVPSVDPFSYTILGRAWNNHEWLFELLAAGLYRAAGWGSFRLLVFLLLGGSLVGIGVAANRRAGPAGALLVVAVEVILADYKSIPVPQLVSMVMLLGGFALFRGRSLVTSAGRPAILALYLLAWGNFTAEVLSFLPFVVVDQVCLRHRQGASPPPVQRLALALFTLALMAPLINPPWASTLDYAVNGTAINSIVNGEFTHLWDPAISVDQVVKNIGLGVILAYLPLGIAQLARATDRWDAVRRTAPSFIAVAAAIAFERNLWLLVLPALDVAEFLAAKARATRGAISASLATVAVAMIIFALGVPAHWTPAAGLREMVSPVFWSQHLGSALPLDCMGPVAEAPEGTRLYTLRMWASYIIWSAHQVRVFGDGRNLEYPVDLFYAGNEIWEGGPRAQEVLDATSTQMVLAYPGWDGLPGIRASAWRETQRGERCAVFERVPEAAANDRAR